MKLKIAQISDIHISATAEPYRGLKVRPNFLRALGQIKKFNPDIMIISGDLAAEYGEPGAYKWVKNQLVKLPFKTYLIPGNHDIPENMDKFLGEFRPKKAKQWFYNLKTSGYNLIFLDTTDNVLPKNQMEWLSDLKISKTYNILFMHHPPLKMGCQFMDSNYPLKNIPQSLKALESVPNLKHVFCGHYHTEKSAFHKSIGIHICPSSAYQINQFESKFQIESYLAGWRSIILDGKTMQSASHYA